MSARFLLGLPFAILLSAAGYDNVSLTVGPERIIIPRGLQAYVYQARNGTLVAQGALPLPDGSEPPTPCSGWYPATIRSTDKGQTWTEWKPAATAGRGPIFEGTGMELQDGTTVLLNRFAEGPDAKGDAVTQRWTSTDQWKTLQGPYESRLHLPRVNAKNRADNGNSCGGVVLHRVMLENTDGSLFTTAYGSFIDDTTPSAYQPSMMESRSLLLRSTDKGATWNLVSTIASDTSVEPDIGEEGYGEPALIRLAQGPHKGRMIVHIRVGRFHPVYQTESDDDGKTWTTVHPLAFHGVDPDLIEMQDGTLVAAFGWRSRGVPDRMSPRLGSYLAFSFDQGVTWSQITQITNELTTSYVAVKEVEPGKLLVIYDKGWWRRPGRAVAQRFINVERKTFVDR